ncbi:MAG TPA: PDR/VanB family oxidoreductase [Lacipirellulaceae bacterium]|nr:PDR/VanB family oxidoreductase [Lacipirellulaceae bacterium]
MLSFDQKTDVASAGTGADEYIDVLVEDICRETEDVKLYTLLRPSGAPFPTISAGAHIDVLIPNGLIRQYSLLKAEENPFTYKIGVKRDENSRGGSQYLHDKVQRGTQLKISAPRNNFPLTEDAEYTIFIAGGIGITPIWSMLNRLTELGRPWQLYYACRAFSQALFVKDLSDNKRVHCHFDDRENGRVLALSNIIQNAPKQSQIYCCGPSPMMAAFKVATAEAWPANQLHTEYFTPAEEKATGRSFTVTLARSGRKIVVAPGKTILETIREAGLNVAYSCQEGICGTCETSVLAGTPDHRDSVLSDAERAENTKMMICCSGSLSDELILDL